jgi:uncharacterized SAM-binding protein YcdF (DUF218 family)
LRNSTKKAIVSRAFKVLLVLTVLWLVAWLAARFLIVTVPLDKADAIAVLSGSSAYLERTHRAADLYFHGRAKFIILTNDGLLSGWSTDLQKNPYFVERATIELVRLGVPRDRITVLPEPLSNTYEESVRLSQFAKTNDVHSIIVVTSPYHSFRAGWIFRRVFAGSGIALGIENSGIAANPMVWWLRRVGWRDVAGEYVKLAYYWWKY